MAFGIYVYYRQRLINEIRNPIKSVITNLYMPVSWFRVFIALIEICKILIRLKNYPEPTIENVGRPNSRVLVRIRDKFLSRLKFPPFYQRIMAAITKLIIIIFDTDLWRPFINWWVDELRDAPDWKHNDVLQPDHHFWDNKEEKTAGGT